MTGYEFEIVVTNLDKDTTEYFNHQTEPDLCCVEAVLMSITIPLIFQSYIYKNNIYLDGAISQAFPIQKYKDENVFAIMLKGARSDPKESFF
jgi:predicted patatin/cPLA2 family phospholipase